MVKRVQEGGGGGGGGVGVPPIKPDGDGLMTPEADGESYLP